MIVDEPAAPANGPVSGVRNLRDAGGIGALPTGVLYRSAALDGLPPAGLRALHSLGVRTVLDLRSAPELAARPDALGTGAPFSGPLGAGSGIRHLHVPVFAEQRWPTEQAELYPLMAELAGRPAAAAVRLLGSADGGAVLVHCASGKDRTGVVIALLQTLLGADEQEVLADFLRSNTALGLTPEPAPTSNLAPAPTPGSAVGPRTGGGGGGGGGHATRPVAAGHLRRALLSVRAQHGTVDAHLRAHGARPAELAALRARFGPGPTAP
ncbi:tyrosine-protein phosphatase [Kitasatospora sp. NPDC088134]|uniref:tyrosine-protein phosphatase n=1 Tax=Kitasatospora sp. NPDC088134 TaxID=3364071 RepID=UPI003829840C